MAIVSIRFSEPEERIVSKLTKYYHEDRSKILKRSVLELYEDLVDKMEIEAFVKREKKSKGKLYSGEDLLKLINSSTSSKKSRKLKVN